jgi:hypothetical protein
MHYYISLYYIQYLDTCISCVNLTHGAVSLWTDPFARFFLRGREGGGRSSELPLL